MSQVPQISPNKAIKTLMDDPIMIGRHRPIVAKWFQAWVDEFVGSKRVPNSEDSEMVALEIKEEILKKLDDLFVVTVDENIPLDENWRRGMSRSKDTELGKEVTVKFYGFRNFAK